MDAFKSGALSPQPVLARPKTPDRFATPTSATPSPMKPSRHILNSIPKSQYLDLVPRMRSLLHDEVISWSEYLHSLEDQPKYRSILGAGRDNSTKALLLLHVLETLPARYAVLAEIYPNEGLVLPDGCAALLERLQKAGEQGFENFEWYYQKFFRNNSFIDSIGGQEEELGAIEAERLSSMRKLQVALVEGCEDAEDVVVMVQAMEAIGLPIKKLLDQNQANVDVGAWR